MWGSQTPSTAGLSRVTSRSRSLWSTYNLTCTVHTTLCLVCRIMLQLRHPQMAESKGLHSSIQWPTQSIFLPPTVASTGLAHETYVPIFLIGKKKKKKEDLGKSSKNNQSFLTLYMNSVCLRSKHLSVFSSYANLGPCSSATTKLTSSLLPV